jgi:hypothetical protein
MPALFLALLTSALAMLGGRSARVTAGMAEALGGSAGLLAVSWLGAIASSAVAAWAGMVMLPLMAPEAKAMFVALALALAAIELFVARDRAAPTEPTRSLGAIALVLFAGQLTDAARFFVLALALATGAPVLAATGGALGSGAVLSAAWALRGEWDERIPARTVRLGIGALFAFAAIVVALSARGLIG